ncbi:hypothetical protein GX441_04190 [bacterium]|nr:hypothetical protein [bacterium]
MKKTFKLLSIAFDSSREAEVLEAMKRAGVHNYIKHDKLTGNVSSCRLEDDHIWPGTFTRYMVEVTVNDYKLLKPLLEELSSRYCEDGFRVLVIPVEEII